MRVPDNFPIELKLIGFRFITWLSISVIMNCYAYCDQSQISLTFLIYNSKMIQARLQEFDQ